MKQKKSKKKSFKSSFASEKREGFGIHKKNKSKSYKNNQRKGI
jgi:hypothetical protein